MLVADKNSSLSTGPIFRGLVTPVRGVSEEKAAAGLEIPGRSTFPADIDAYHRMTADQRSRPNVVSPTGRLIYSYVLRIGRAQCDGWVRGYVILERFEDLIRLYTLAP